MSSKRRSSYVLVVALTAAFVSGACSHKIGDSCQIASDCDPSGTRICDLSQPGGYCTILGCNEVTCPSEATCVRYFPTQYLTKTCIPACEDIHCALADGGSDDAGADAGPPCAGSEGAICPTGPTNNCSADETCVPIGSGAGLCAPLSTELRYCALVCSSNDDCRGGYECRPTGSGGAVVLSATVGAETSFCTPAAQ